MHEISESTALTLGIVANRPIRLTSAALHIAEAHARRLADSLGTSDAESSLAGYWALGDRIHQWQRIVDRLGVERARSMRFAEVGSGMGLFTLTGAALGFQVVGFEASSDRYLDSLQVARALFGSNDLSATLVQAYAEQLPLPDQSIDLVASFQTFEHVANLPQTLREIRRVLKPGGVLFAQAPNYAAFYEAHYGVILPLILGKKTSRQLLRVYGRPAGFIDHLQWLKPSWLRGLLQEVGFTSYSVGPIAGGASTDTKLPGEGFAAPFRLRRGRYAERLANRLGGIMHRLSGRPDWYTQLEIWATA